MQVRQKVLIMGGVVGLLVGLAAAFLFLKANEARIAAVEAGEEESLGKISPAEGISVGMTVIGLLKQIVSLGG
ncbi:MAG: hypothetical protein JW934_11780 [Anaerolineae bacterium]|nr:hypothetical protein [Anaerolineae bacterium]